MEIGDKRVGGDLLLIAEAGSTHRGNVQTAMNLATVAKEAGADAIKFIASNPAELISDRTLEFEGQPLYDVIESYRFRSDQDWYNLAAHCRDIEIPFFVSVGTLDYIPLMEDIGCQIYKCGGWDTRHFYLIEALLKTKKPLIFDLGAVIGGEVENLLDFCYEKTASEADMAFLYESHGELNMHSITYLQHKFQLPVGFSSDGVDRTPDIIAITLGADLIEKRIKPDTGSGHHRDKALTPEQFKYWVKEMRDAKQMVGRYGLFPSLADVSAKSKWFTSLVFDRDVARGEIITREMLAAKRPGLGWSPLYDYLFIGKPLKKAVERNQVVTPDVV